MTDNTVSYASRTALADADILYPQSWVGHVPFGRWIVANTKPHLVVELGTHTGVSLFAFANGACDESHACRIVAVDHWRGDEHAGSYDAGVLETLCKQIGETFVPSEDGPTIELLQRTFDDALFCFGDGTIDLLHIDGLHTYEAVRHDFETWLPKLSPRGVVLMHDTHVLERGFGVHRFYAELNERYPTFAFSHSHGLGVVLVGADAPAALSHLVAGKADQVGLVPQEFFGRLGEGLMAAARLHSLEEEVDRLAEVNMHWLELYRKQFMQHVKQNELVIGSFSNNGPDELEAQILQSGLFDSEFYRTQAELEETRPVMLLRHYLSIGELRGIRPSKKFDPRYYGVHNSDVLDAGIPLLIHFVQHGIRENRKPC